MPSCNLECSFPCPGLDGSKYQVDITLASWVERELAFDVYKLARAAAPPYSICLRVATPRMQVYRYSDVIHEGWPALCNADQMETPRTAWSAACMHTKRCARIQTYMSVLVAPTSNLLILTPRTKPIVVSKKRIQTHAV